MLNLRDFASALEQSTARLVSQCVISVYHTPAPLRLLIHGSSPLMHELLDLPDPNFCGIELSGTPTEEDYDTLASTLTDHLEQHTTTRVLFVMKNVDDWEPREHWEELVLDIRHLRDLDKVAVVGDDLRETEVETIEELFPMSMVQTYELGDRDEALDWLRGDMAVPGLGPGSMADPEAEAQDEE